MSEIVLRPAGFVRNGIAIGSHPAGKPPDPAASPEKHALWRERIRQAKEARNSASELVIDDKLDGICEDIEAINGSPILDIKPQTGDHYDNDERRVPDWIREIHQAFDEDRIND